MAARVIIFLELCCFIGVMAYFSGQHEEHLSALQETMDRIEAQAKASYNALQYLQDTREDIVCARKETDKKLLDACDLDDAMRYEYYDRLLREDAERRLCPPAGKPAASHPAGELH